MPVFRGKQNHREWPRNAQRGIIRPNASRLFRQVELAHLVEHLGIVRQRLKSVRHERRHVEGPSVGRRQFDREMPGEPDLAKVVEIVSRHDAELGA